MKTSFNLLDMVLLSGCTALVAVVTCAYTFGFDYIKLSDKYNAAKAVIEQCETDGDFDVVVEGDNWCTYQELCK